MEPVPTGGGNRGAFYPNQVRRGAVGWVRRAKTEEWDDSQERSVVEWGDSEERSVVEWGGNEIQWPAQVSLALNNEHWPAIAVIYQLHGGNWESREKDLPRRHSASKPVPPKLLSILFAYSNEFWSIKLGRFLLTFSCVIIFPNNTFSHCVLVN